MTDQDILKQARETAAAMAKRMQKAYLQSVKKSIDAYGDAYEPDEEDFFAWLEGYDWRDASD